MQLMEMMIYDWLAKLRVEAVVVLTCHQSPARRVPKPQMTEIVGIHSDNGLSLLRKPPQCGQEAAVPNHSL